MSKVRAVSDTEMSVGLDIIADSAKSPNDLVQVTASVLRSAAERLSESVLEIDKLKRERALLQAELARLSKQVVFGEPFVDAVHAAHRAASSIVSDALADKIAEKLIPHINSARLGD